MSSKRIALAVGCWCIVLLGSAQVARAQEQRVVDQLLDILRKNKQISEQQYKELKQQAEEERQQDLRKAAAPAPSPTPVAAAAAAPPPSPPPGETMRAYFKNGFNLESADGAFKFSIGALTQVDANVSDPGSGVKKKYGLHGTYTGAEFRRARLSVSGIVYNNVDFKFEYDFAGGTPAFKDVYMGMNKIPFVQYVRVGHFKQPFSLEELTPDTYTTFMERATMNAFAQPDRNTGIAAYQNFLDGRVSLANGAFRLADNFGNGFGSDSPYNINSRLTGLPLYDAGKELLHIGLSYSHQFRHNSVQTPTTVTFSSRPESHLFPVNLVNTGALPTGGVDLINPEVAFVWGPWSAQGEYTWALVSEPALPDSQLNGGYIEGSYFLTGESRSSFYKTQFGHFDRVIPIENFSLSGKGWGSWQVAARYSYMDLNSNAVRGGALDDITFGVNWYLNPVTRIALNYVWAQRESVDSSNIVQARFQLAF